MVRRVLVRSPATSANLGPAFDSAGLCLGLYDRVEVEVLDRGLDLHVEGEGADTLPRSEEHLVLQALRATFDRLGGQPGGLRVACRNAVPQARGLGSSSAAIVAGVLAARALVEDGDARLDDDAVLALADALEGHPDNVAACLRGGLTLAWHDEQGLRVTRRDVHPDLAPVVLVPVERSSTRQVRALLPAQVPHADAAANAGRAALLGLALTADPSLLLAATRDLLHQPYRAPAMPRTAEVVEQLRAGGLAATVSGAGPTVLVLATRPQLADVLGRVPEGWTAHALAVPPGGASVEVLREH